MIHAVSDELPDEGGIGHGGGIQGVGGGQHRQDSGDLRPVGQGLQILQQIGAVNAQLRGVEGVNIAVGVGFEGQG